MNCLPTVILELKGACDMMVKNMAVDVPPAWILVPVYGNDTLGRSSGCYAVYMQPPYRPWRAYFCNCEREIN